MSVKVIDGLASVPVRVDYDAISVVGQTFLLRDKPRESQ
jgi:hypothetical protein